jgi:hypothetical protein
MVLAATVQGLVLGSELLEPWASATERQAAVLALLEQAPTLPRVLRVGRPEVEGLVAPVAEGLGIRTQVADVALLEQLKGELLGYLAGS